MKKAKSVKPMGAAPKKSLGPTFPIKAKAPAQAKGPKAPKAPAKPAFFAKKKAK